jgi:hypothetical protein
LTSIYTQHLASYQLRLAISAFTTPSAHHLLAINITTAGFIYIQITLPVYLIYHKPFSRSALRLSTGPSTHRHRPSAIDQVLQPSPTSSNPDHIHQPTRAIEPPMNNDTTARESHGPASMRLHRATTSTNESTTLQTRFHCQRYNCAHRHAVEQGRYADQRQRLSDTQSVSGPAQGIIEEHLAERDNKPLQLLEHPLRRTTNRRGPLQSSATTRSEPFYRRPSEQLRYCPFAGEPARCADSTCSPDGSSRCSKSLGGRG